MVIMSKWNSNQLKYVFNIDFDNIINQTNNLLNHQTSDHILIISLKYILGLSFDNIIDQTSKL